MTPAASTWPQVYVLTLNWNGKRWLGECLDAILSMAYPSFQTVVIDNGSTDGSAEYVRVNYPTVHLLENGANLGYARGFNVGLRYSFEQRDADYCLVMNNDTKIDKKALSALVQVAESHDRVAFVTGKVYCYDRPNVLQTVGKVDQPVIIVAPDIGAQEEDCGQHDSVIERSFVDDVFSLVSRQLYADIGGYDEQFFLQCEEYDWQWRAKERGWHIFYTPYAKLWHHGSLTMGGGSNAISSYFLARNLVVVMARHTRGRRFARFLLLSIYWRIRAFVAGLVGGTPRHRDRIAAGLGLAAGLLWLIFRKPATGIPRLIRSLNGK